MLRNPIAVAASAAALAAFAPAANAADLPMYEPAPSYAAPAPVAPPTWSGAYVGAQAGYNWGKANNSTRAPNTKPEGGLVGAYAGYNVQFENSPVVAGVETDINYDTADDRKRFGAAGLGRVKNEQEWSGATRGRIGYAMGNVMVYGAGGLAYAGQKVSRSGPAGGGSDKNTALGWTAGGGVEALLTDNVTARAEYRYNDYGTEKFKVGGGSIKSSTTENRVTAGVAYKFSGW